MGAIEPLQPLPQMNARVCMLDGCKIEGRVFDRSLGCVCDGHNSSHDVAFENVDVKHHVVVVANAKSLSDITRNAVEGAFTTQQSSFSPGTPMIRDKKAVS